MVQMQRHRDGAVLGVLLDGLRNVVGTDLLVFQGAIGEVRAAAHKGVGQVRALDDGGGTEHLVNLNDGLGLSHSIDIESALGVVILFGSLQDGSHGY